MSPPASKVSEDPLRALDEGTVTPAALRAIATLPKGLLSRGAHVCLFVGGVFLARDTTSRRRSMNGLFRALIFAGVLRDFYHAKRMPPGRRIHPAGVGILDTVQMDRRGLVPAGDTFVATGQAVSDTVTWGQSPDIDRFAEIINEAFENLLPVLTAVMERQQAVVTALRARKEALAERARIGSSGGSFLVIAAEITNLAGQVDVGGQEILGRIEDIVVSSRAI
ncbi:hypothetical protein [Jannaschia donghaensis]|uniref:Uncharacterized protein n=1 Tax=Jannaschia donghaensis TaxID=420998 RepID=A0A0M6YHZ3_9RHOB|nr:hypothetical protein [Jannaschia donghaensis]CTQ49972.1 hypothetical protein JDO7802_01989 [Jannaschia donghaensis]